jgi:hypothetical protein
VPVITIRVGLDDNHDVRHAQDGLTREVCCLVSGPQRVDEYDLQVWPYKWKIIVAPVPDDDVCPALGKPDDAGVARGKVPLSGSPTTP